MSLFEFNWIPPPTDDALKELCNELDGANFRDLNNLDLRFYL